MGCLRMELDGTEKAIDLAVGGRREHDDGGGMERAACNCMMNNGSVCCEVGAWMYL